MKHFVVVFSMLLFIIPLSFTLFTTGYRYSQGCSVLHHWRIAVPGTLISLGQFSLWILLLQQLIGCRERLFFHLGLCELKVLTYLISFSLSTSIWNILHKENTAYTESWSIILALGASCCIISYHCKSEFLTIIFIFTACIARLSGKNKDLSVHIPMAASSENWSPCRSLNRDLELFRTLEQGTRHLNSKMGVTM